MQNKATLVNSSIPDVVDEQRKVEYRAGYLSPGNLLM